ncbi:hypothetical protein OK107_12345 [Lacticaseibacillus paracasei]|uniref:hypothetical protein n=1 Tax=Lacticaseibacillus paracasei TaxID=1597 RepID=UPI0022EC46E4|nr:hypothetical protein [Lacticaseibacillus paracasei]WBS98847.1 hypothetical protein OK107_12345 [Lacticaseibacillus paracasei]
MLANFFLLIIFAIIMYYVIEYAVEKAVKRAIIATKMQPKTVAAEYQAEQAYQDNAAIIAENINELKKTSPHRAEAKQQIRALQELASEHNGIFYTLKNQTNEQKYQALKELGTKVEQIKGDSSNTAS